jgi:GT2 family glycosyltransferase
MGFEEVKSKFSKVKNIEILVNRQNKGYGFGNNVGIKSLVDAGVRYIVISNPDIEISSPLVLYEMFRVIEESKYIVIAPQVFNLQSQVINPSNRECPSIKEIGIMRLKHSSIIKYIYYLSLILIYFLSFNKWKRKRKDFFHNSKVITTEVYRVHGSFFIFDSQFFISNQIFPIFDENVFLFFEEYVIAEKVKAFGGKILLLNYIDVLHKEDTSQKKNIFNRIKYDIMASKSLAYIYKNYFEKHLSNRKKYLD